MVKAFYCSVYSIYIIKYIIYKINEVYLITVSNDIHITDYIFV